MKRNEEKTLEIAFRNFRVTDLRIYIPSDVGTEPLIEMRGPDASKNKEKKRPSSLRFVNVR